MITIEKTNIKSRKKPGLTIEKGTERTEKLSQSTESDVGELVNVGVICYLKQVYPGAAKWQNTLMPYFKELSIIFGKDRATGNLAENLEDVVEELNAETADEVSLQQEPSTHSDESTSKKRKKGNIDSLLEAVYAASDRIANQFEASTKLLIAAEEDMMSKKKQLNEEISKIPGLNVLQKLQVAKKIAKDEDLMILFFAAPAEEKSVFVNGVLNGEI